jgi:hypothetical protein
MATIKIIIGDVNKKVLLENLFWYYFIKEPLKTSYVVLLLINLDS